MRLYQERAVNRSVGDLLDTLRSDAVDRIDFVAEDAPGAQPSLSLTKQDRAAFTISEVPPEIVVDETRRLALSIRSLAFQEENKWRLFDGQNTITATIEDQDFIDRVDLNLVRFAKGDVLICEVRTIQTQGDDGLRTEHAVLRVVEHRQAPAQIRLPFADV